jgi:predicted ribosome quality control (RQC) complex YloA/Tae2 family protein
MDNETEALKRAEAYERHGKLILANLADLKKGMKSVTLTDPADGPVSLSLDPSLTPARNAEKYFDKSKKARASISEAGGYRKELGRKLAFAQDLLEKLEGIESPEAFGEFAGQNTEPLSALGIKLDKRGKSVEEKIPFRVFTVAGGFQVWAGKSGENNDLLTLKHAKPNDLWFHARGSGGSHVVLKVGTGKGEPSRQAMEQAAAIAAYYSKMKNSRMVPVAMTQKKYVRKPRGVPAGTVTIEREKVFFVEPELPQQEEGK